MVLEIVQQLTDWIQLSTKGRRLRPAKAGHSKLGGPVCQERA